jgi:hypothetical protein
MYRYSQKEIFLFYAQARQVFAMSGICGWQLAATAKQGAERPDSTSPEHVQTSRRRHGCEPIMCMAAASTVSFALAAAETSVHNIDMQSAHTTGVITIAW